MATKLKIPEIKEFYLNIQYVCNGDILMQIFNFVANNKKSLHYAYDMRYSLKAKIDQVIEKENKTSAVIEFLRRFDMENSIVIHYKILDGRRHNFKNVIKNLSFYMPPYSGCEYCQKCNIENNMIYCNEKKKYLKSFVKTCKIFLSKTEMIT